MRHRLCKYIMCHGGKEKLSISVIDDMAVIHDGIELCNAKLAKDSGSFSLIMSLT